MNKSFNKNELIESLHRSGYLLESRIVSLLQECNFFVEPNQSILDTKTGKSREIDLVAEFYNYNKQRHNVSVKTNFIIEIINNSYPYVLMTQRDWTPNVPEDAYLKYVTSPGEDNNPFLSEIDIWEFKDTNNYTYYSQYCSFTRKKANSELMACHPEDLYTSINKLAEYCLNEIDDWQLSESTNIWRIFFWNPILVLKDDLFILKCENENKLELVETDCGKLEYNLYFKDEPETIAIDIITEKGLLPFLKKTIQTDDKIEAELFKHYQKLNKNSNLDF